MTLDAYGDMKTCRHCEAHFRTVEKVELCSRCREGADPAAHYGHTVRAPISSDDIARGYTEVRLDPYRVADVYRMKGGPREQIMKKCLRWTDKNQTEDQVIAEIESALKRWKEMRAEDMRVPL